MVFERATGLAERIETGVPIDGLVSSGLLQNILLRIHRYMTALSLSAATALLLPAACCRLRKP